MGNFIGMVYATLKNEGVDTKGMSTDDAVKKYNELQGKSGGKSGEKEPTPAENRAMSKMNEKEIKSEIDKTIADIKKSKKNGEKITSAEILSKLWDEKSEMLPKEDGQEYSDIKDYIRQQVNEKSFKEKMAEFAEGRKDVKVENEIDYDNVRYPKGTSKEYTMMVNDRYRNAIYRLRDAGIDIKDFKYKPAKEGGIITNTAGIMQKYIFEPFNKKYPKGNNSAWENDYKPLYDAINAVDDKVYNDWWILNK